MATPDDIDQDDLAGGTNAVNDENADGVQPGEVVGEAVEVDGAEGGQTGEGEGADDAGEVVITLGDESPAPAEGEEDGKAAPQWLKELRKSNREMVRALREKDAQIAALKGGNAQPDAVVLGAKPTLAACDFDEERFEQELEAWHTTKAKVESQARAKEEAQRVQQAAWEKKLQAHDEAKLKLRVPDFDDAAATVEDNFSVVQRGILIDCAKDSAALMYALGKNPAKLKELAAIQNPAHFTWALSQLETKLKVEPRRAAPTPDRTVRGSGSLAGTTDRVLESLQAEADRTGDRSKVAKYLRDKGKKAA